MENVGAGKESQCLNCGSLIADNYCSLCGQSSSVGRITFRETFESFLSSAFSFEGPFRRTTSSLITNPGLVFREFIEGKRKKYYKPVAYFILLTAIYLLIRTLIDYDPLQGQIPEDIAESQRQAEVNRLTSEAARYMVKNINNIMFLLVFAIALLLKLFFPKRYFLAEYTAVGFYIVGIYILFGTLLMLFNHLSGMRLNQLQLAFLVLYMIYCQWSFYQSNKFWNVLKYLIVGAFSLILYVLLGFGFSMIIVALRA